MQDPKPGFQDLQNPKPGIQDLHHPKPGILIRATILDYENTIASGSPGRASVRPCGASCPRCAPCLTALIHSDGAYLWCRSQLAWRTPPAGTPPPPVGAPPIPEQSARVTRDGDRVGPWRLCDVPVHRPRRYRPRHGDRSWNDDAARGGSGCCRGVIGVLLSVIRLSSSCHRGVSGAIRVSSGLILGCHLVVIGVPAGLSGRYLGWHVIDLSSRCHRVSSKRHCVSPCVTGLSSADRCVSGRDATFRKMQTETKPIPMK